MSGKKSVARCKCSKYIMQQDKTITVKNSIQIFHCGNAI